MVFKYLLKFLSYKNTKYECAIIEKVMCNAVFNYYAYLVILVQLEKIVHNNWKEMCNKKPFEKVIVAL